jgi:hypothetical protein
VVDITDKLFPGNQKGVPFADHFRVSGPAFQKHGIQRILPKQKVQNVRNLLRPNPIIISQKHPITGITHKVKAFHEITVYPEVLLVPVINQLNTQTLEALHHLGSIVLGCIVANYDPD